MQSRAASVGDDRSPNDDGIASKSLRFVGAHLNQLRNMGRQRRAAIVIKSRWIVNRLPSGQRTKASVEMIVVRIDQFDRDNSATNHFANLLMPARVAADAIARKQR